MIFLFQASSYMAFNIFQVYQYYDIYRQYFFLKLNIFHELQHVSYATVFEIKRYQLPF
jgi:hypothetical protein